MSDTYLLTTQAELTSVANALRSKTGKSDLIIYPDEFVSTISDLTSKTDWATRTITSFSNSTITAIGSFAFGGCSSLITVSIPAVTSVF